MLAHSLDEEPECHFRACDWRHWPTRELMPRREEETQLSCELRTVDEEEKGFRRSTGRPRIGRSVTLLAGRPGVFPLRTRSLRTRGRPPRISGRVRTRTAKATPLARRTMGSPRTRIRIKQENAAVSPLNNKKAKQMTTLARSRNRARKRTTANRASRGTTAAQRASRSAAAATRLKRSQKNAYPRSWYLYNAGRRAPRLS